MINMTLVGKPMLWKTQNYGTIAVHVTGLSPNGQVLNLTIDGGEASTPAQRFPELSDGIAFATVGQLSKRPATRTKKAAPVRELAESAGIVPQRARKPRGRAGEIRRQAAMGQTGTVTF